MRNLYVPPEVHLLKHALSGKKLDIGNAEPCVRCEAMGYRFYTFLISDKLVICPHCNGSGHEPIGENAGV